MAILLEEELKTYEENKQDLIRVNGKYVLIKGKTIVDTFE